MDSNKEDKLSKILNANYKSIFLILALARSKEVHFINSNKGNVF